MTQDEETDQLIAAALEGMAYPRDGDLRTWLEEDTGYFLAAGATATPEQQRAFVRKLARYYLRGGETNDAHAEHHLAIQMAATRPEILSTRIGFGGLVRKASDSIRKMLRQSSGRRLREHIADRDAYCPPRPVLFRSGSFTLEQLVHARHFFEAGEIFNNCLRRRISGTAIANFEYVEKSLRGALSVYVLCDNGHPRFLFSVLPARIHEWWPMKIDANAEAVLPACLPAILERQVRVLTPADPLIHWRSDVRPPPSRDQLWLPFIITDLMDAER